MSHVDVELTPDERDALVSYRDSLSPTGGEVEVALAATLAASAAGATGAATLAAAAWAGADPVPGASGLSSAVRWSLGLATVAVLAWALVPRDGPPDRVTPPHVNAKDRAESHHAGGDPALAVPPAPPRPSDDPGLDAADRVADRDVAETPPTRGTRRVASEPLPSIAEEVRLMRRATSAIEREQWSAAAKALKVHARKFPRGALVQERELGRVRVLCGQGRKDAARRSARALAAKFPGSPQANRAAKVCPSP